VIPKELRDALGIEPGDEVTFWRHEDHVAVRPAKGRASLRGRFHDTGLSEVLALGRREDREREDRG
jgi:AbrB family looped-hinge helix DNA binding protein